MLSQNFFVLFAAVTLGVASSANGFMKALLNLDQARSRNARGAAECYEQVLECQQKAMTFVAGFGNSPMAVIGKIQATPLRTICNDFGKILDCAAGISISDCQQMPDVVQVLQMVPRVKSIHNYVCVKEFAAFDANKMCLVDMQTIGGSQGCLDSDAMNECRPDSFITCVGGVLDKNSKCTPKAKSVVGTLTRKLVALQPQCATTNYEFSRFQELAHNFLAQF